MSDTTASQDEGTPFSWTDFVVLAEALAGMDDEASLRTAVSRGYYAVFHLAQMVLERHDPEFHSLRVSDSHKQVWDRLQSIDRRQAKTAVRSGRSLLNKRKQADYRLNVGDWPRQTTQALAEVKRAVAALTDLLD
jgi:hypothetical protein